MSQMKITRTMQLLSQEDFNSMLKRLSAYHLVVVGKNKPKKSSRTLVSVTYDRTRAYISYRENSKIVRYYTRLDGDCDTQYVTPVQVWSDLIKLCGKKNIPDLRHSFGYEEIEKPHHETKIKWCITCPGGYHYHNDKYVGEYLENCYGYDINSSYSFAMTKDMPDTSVEPRFYDSVNKGEIGFMTNGDVCFEGFAEYIFPLIKSPFLPFIDKYYDMKIKSAKNKKKRSKYKQILNIPTGYVQRLNPFLRNAIIYYAKEYVKQYIDDNTLYVNTDSIVSLVPRPDIPLDQVELGKFKLDHQGSFTYWGQGQYEWNGEKHHQGIPLYMLNNKGICKYKFDEKKVEVVLNG